MTTPKAMSQTPAPMTQPVVPYAPPARWLHWLTALAVLLVIPAGIAMNNVPQGPTQDRLFDFHRSVGILILALAVLRVATRILLGAPPPAPGLIQRAAATEPRVSCTIGEKIWMDHWAN